jgi:hypothetical protein
MGDIARLCVVGLLVLASCSRSPAPERRGVTVSVDAGAPRAR